MSILKMCATLCFVYKRLIDLRLPMVARVFHGRLYCDLDRGRVDGKEPKEWNCDVALKKDQLATKSKCCKLGLVGWWPPQVV